MNNYSKIYWLTRLDSIQCFLSAITILGIITIIVIIAGGLMSRGFDEFYQGEKLKNREDIRKKLYGKIKLIVFLVISLGLINTFLPSKNEAILILAGGKTLNFIQNDTSINKIPSQTTAIITNYLDKTLNEIKKENK